MSKQSQPLVSITDLILCSLDFRVSRGPWIIVIVQHLRFQSGPYIMLDILQIEQSAVDAAAAAALSELDGIFTLKEKQTNGKKAAPRAAAVLLYTSGSDRSLMKP